LRFACILATALCAGAQTPLDRAVAYLTAEVPRWSRENGCFSCHNNGDAARALFAAKARGIAVPAAAIADTVAWLKTPGSWDENKGNPAFSDKKLARLQFAIAAVDAGANARAAAESIVALQDPDGSWTVDASTPAGSPVTWGTALATWLASNALQRAQIAPEAVARANAWFGKLTPTVVPEAAAKLMAMPNDRESRQFILAAQAGDGGWGPRRGAPSEPFDTALAILALRDVAGADAAIERGRKFLIATQLPEGGWPGTTRPPGGQSYAQHISTSGWATLALLTSDHR
jgi:hypothetical protein